MLAKPPAHRIRPIFPVPAVFRLPLWSERNYPPQNLLIYVFGQPDSHGQRSAAASRLENLLPPGRQRLNSQTSVQSTSPVKPVLINVIKLAISAGLIYYLFRQAMGGDDFDRLLNAPKDWAWLAVGFAACVGAFLISFFRWQLLVRALELPFSLLDAIRLGFIGLFFCVFTIGVVGGDALRAIYVCRQSPNKKAEAIASVVFDRVIGLLTMVTIAAVAFCRLNAGTLATPQGTAVLAIVGLVGFVFLLAVPALQRQPVLAKILGRVLAIPKLGPFARKLIDVVGVYRKRPGTILVSFLLSVAVNVCFAITIYAIAVGLGTPHPSLAEHFLIEPVAMVANSVPLPGGIGGMEMAVELMYRALADSGGVVIAFTFRFFILVSSAFGGVLWLFNRESFDKLKSAASAGDAVAKDLT